jgi:murein tripeptide amidase MpaA
VTVYLNVDEIESAMDALAAQYPTEAEVLTPPHATHAGRRPRLLRLGRRASDADGLLVLGGVHAREWVPPDALISLAADLLEASAAGTGLVYGSTRYTAVQVRQVLDTVDLLLYPCVNPDGRAHSQATAPMWRKNRRPPPDGSRCAGVDLNRNFDFLWDHSAKFAPDSQVRTSADACSDVYRGPDAGSEPETRNVVWALDTYPRIQCHLDVHSAVPVVLHVWGCDQIQTTHPAEDFRNPALDAVRGRPGDGVGEYLSGSDLALTVALAQRMDNAIRGVRGVRYGVEPAYGLYPTSGTSDDYAFSRHKVDPRAGKVLGYTIECGESFQPAWAEAENVIREVSAAILALALGVHEVAEGSKSLDALPTNASARNAPAALREPEQRDQESGGVGLHPG